MRLNPILRKFEKLYKQINSNFKRICYNNNRGFTNILIN